MVKDKLDKFHERLERCKRNGKFNPNHFLFQLLVEGQRDLSQQLQSHETRISHIEGKITVLLTLSGASLTLILLLFKLLLV